MESEKNPAVDEAPADQAEGGAYGSETISRIRQDPKAIGALFKEGKYPYTDRIPRSTYEKEKALLQIELLKVQNWVKITGQKIVIVFEGRDAAGKGGVIKRITERVSPRVFRVVALPAPSDRQKTQWYPQRYVEHFPAAGEIAPFDRSRDNPAGVERVLRSIADELCGRLVTLAEPERDDVRVAKTRKRELGDAVLLQRLEVGAERARACRAHPVPSQPVSSQAAQSGGSTRRFACS